MIANRPALLERLRTLNTPDISDALTRLNVRAVRMWGVLPLKRFESERHIAGPAVTIRFLPCHRKQQYQESRFKLTEIVEAAPAGSVVVIAAESEEHIPPIEGEMNALTEVRSRLEAHVGATPVRDIDALLPLPIPIFHRQVPAPIGMSSYVGLMYCVGANEPIHCAGALVRPGDIIVGDNNGVVVVPEELLETVVDISSEIAALETEMRKQVIAGVSWKEIYAGPHSKKYISSKTTEP